MKPFKVVCINRIGWVDIDTGRRANGPKYGDIDEVELSFINPRDNDHYFFLVGYNGIDEREMFHVDEFRPVDETFGEVVCETIEQQIELEETITV